MTDVRSGPVSGMGSGGASSSLEDAPTKSLSGSEPTPETSPEPTPETTPESSSEPSSSPGEPVVDGVAHYVGLEEVGRGGMGRVLRAYDPRLQREVALKEVHGHALDEDAADRLVAEARAMAKLSHPNVVAVHDVEERRSGEVVLVMEYVAGQTLRKWLRRDERSWREIVRCFIAAGRGLQAAHDAGLLHRDFKPANVLVQESNGADSATAPVVKVTDFGLAKLALASPSSEGPETLAYSRGVETLAGSIVGTPRYMAPEQLRGESVTPAVDQYAFCVALWEALCGEPPFAGDHQELEDAKGSGPPAWPRPSTPRPIAAAVVRGLAPSPEDRWPSMAALLEALSFDPWRRRRRWLLALGGVGVIAATGSSWSAWWQARSQRCEGARQKLDGIWDDARRGAVSDAMEGVDKPYAVAVGDKARRDLDEYALGWVQMHTEACEATVLRHEQSTEVLDLRMACLRRAAVDLRATVDTLVDVDASTVDNVHELTGGLPSLARCADVEALAAEVEPPLPEDQDAVEVARTELARAQSLELAGRYQDARAALEAANAAVEGVEYVPIRSELALREGSLLELLGEYEASESALTEALESSLRIGQPELTARAAMSLMYVVGYRRNEPEHGLRYWPMVEALTRGRPLQEAAGRSHLASVLRAQGKHDEALAEQQTVLSLRREALGPEHPITASTHNNLAHVLYRMGKYADAEAEFRAALGPTEASVGPGHPEMGQIRQNLGASLLAQGRYSDAEVEFQAALALRKEALGLDHPHVGESWNGVAIVLAQQGKHAEAEAEFRGALALWERALGPDHVDVAPMWVNLAEILKLQGKLDEAAVTLRSVLPRWTESLGPDDHNVASMHRVLGGVLWAQGRQDDALAEHRAALAVFERTLEPEHPTTAVSRYSIANMLFELDRLDEALPLAERSWAALLRDDVPEDRRARSAFLLARILVSIDGDARDRDRALSLAEGAASGFRRSEGEHADEVDEVDQWLGEQRTR